MQLTATGQENHHENHICYRLTHWAETDGAKCCCQAICEMLLPSYLSAEIALKPDGTLVEATLHVRFKQSQKRQPYARTAAATFMPHQTHNLQFLRAARARDSAIHTPSSTELEELKPRITEPP